MKSGGRLSGLFPYAGISGKGDFSYCPSEPITSSWLGMAKKGIGCRKRLTMCGCYEVLYPVFPGSFPQNLQTIFLSFKLLDV